MVIFETVYNELQQSILKKKKIQKEIIVHNMINFEYAML